MNKNRKMVIVLLFAFILCFSLAGCTLQDGANLFLVKDIS